MPMMIVLPDTCKNCGEPLILDELVQGRRRIIGGEQLFWICPCCRREIEMDIRRVDK